MSSTSLDVAIIDEDINIDTLKFKMSSYIIELKEAKKSFRDTIEPLIQRASIEMCKYVKDHSMICTYLCQVFPKDMSRDIRRYIDPRFKREYIKEAIEQMPLDTVQELLTLIIDNENDVIDGAQALLKFYNEASAEDKKILSLQLIEEFGSLPKLNEFIESLKEFKIEARILKNKTDKRIQIDILSKLLLKIQTFYLSKNYVKNLNNISTKWITAGIQQRGSLEEIAQKLFQADARLSHIYSWFEKQLAKIETQEDPKFDPIPDFKPILAQRNKELEEEVRLLRMDLEKATSV